MKWKWPWDRTESEEVIEAQRRLDSVVEDDQRVRELQRRTRRILRENNLAPAIMKALGVNHH